MKLNHIKIAIDVVITIALGLLYTTHGALGLAFHEWAGILILIGFIVHVAVSWDWVVAVTKRLFGATKPRARFQYVLDILVLVSMAWTIVSGVLISRIATPQLASSAPLWRATHVPISYLTLIIIGVHLGMHWEWLLSTLRRLTKRPRATGALRWLLAAVAALVFAGGVYATLVTGAVTRAVAVQSGEGGMRGGGEGGMRGGHVEGAAPPGAQPAQPGRPGGGMGHGPGGGEGMRGGASGSDLTSLALHTGVIAAFAVPTYYADQLVSRSRRKNRATA